MLLDKYTQLNCINDVWEPLYHDPKVYIAKWKVKRSKLDIKLTFPKVLETSGYYGAWYISRKDALKSRATFNNNGMECLAISWDKF